MCSLSIFYRLFSSNFSYFIVSHSNHVALAGAIRQYFVRYSSSSSILRCLKTFGVKKEDIYNCPKLFDLPIKELSEKSQFLNGKISREDDILSLLLLPKKDLLKYLEIRKKKNKILDLAGILKCSEHEACQRFVKHRFLLRSKMSTIKEKINIMTDGGILLDDIKKDLWVLTYTKEHLRFRIKAANKLNIYPIRPWMLRCKEEVLLRAKSNKEENLLAMLPHKSSEEYICDRLELSRSQFNALVSKYPPAARVQVSKLKELFDFLLYEGFKASQISQTPRIFCHSIQTIKERLISLRENKYNPQNLSILCKNKKKFDSFIKKIKTGSNGSTHI